MERIEIEHKSASRRENCQKVALDFMERNIMSLAAAAMKSESEYITKPKSHLFLSGYEEGFSMAIELLLSGNMQINEVKKSNHGSESARQGGGPADSD